MFTVFNKRLIFILLALVFAPKTFAQTVDEAQLRQVAESPEWKLLLHYRVGSQASRFSEIDGGDFFLSADGRKDPLAELKATLAAVTSDKKIGRPLQVPRCAFRARYHFLENKLKTKFPDRDCPEWRGFISLFHHPQSVSLVFSSSYANNPASMFGHIFLKVDSDRNNDLLAMGINYAALVPPDENPFAFFYFGIFGGYGGHWSTQPYYEKLNEYVKAESRDLWQYRLNLSPDETHFLLEHLWELETTGRKAYYFFDDNCAYQVMRLIEIVKPEWTHLSDHTIYSIPGELVKNLYNNPGVVHDVQLRPALRKKLLQKYDTLNAGERKDFRSIISEKASPTQIDDPQVLETVSAFYDFQRQKKKGQLTTEQFHQWDLVRSKRATLGEAHFENMQPILGDTRPDLGHDAYALSPCFGIETTGAEPGRAFTCLRIQSAYHDLWNNDLGFKKYSEIQFPWVEVRYRPQRHNWNLEELGFIRVTSLSPLERLDFNLSWETEAGFQSPKDFGCLNCRVLAWKGGLGTALDVISPNHILYQFFALRAEADPIFQKGYRLLPTLELGWISTLHQNWKLGAQASYSQDFSGEAITDQFYQLTQKLSYSFERNLELREELGWVYSRLSSRPNYEQARLNLYYYFR